MRAKTRLEESVVFSFLSGKISSAKKMSEASAQTSKLGGRCFFGKCQLGQSSYKVIKFCKKYDAPTTQRKWNRLQRRGLKE